MNSYYTGIESIYEKIGQTLLSHEVITGKVGLTSIIKGCRLRPLELKAYYTAYDFINSWKDEYGNTLEIKDKEIIIIYNNLAVKEISCTDLYDGISLDKVKKISKLCHIVYGIDEDLGENCYYLTFLGIDGYYRTYMYAYGEWKKVSTLMLGIKNLFQMVDNTNIHFDIKLKCKSIIPMEKNNCIMTTLPISEKLSNVLVKHELIYNYLR